MRLHGGTGGTPGTGGAPGAGAGTSTPGAAHAGGFGSLPPEAALVQVADDLLSTPDELAGSLARLEAPFVVAGDGALRYAPLFARVPGATLASAAFAHPRAEVLAALGTARLREGAGVDAVAVAPRYLREADVRINWEQRLPPREPQRAAG